MPCVPRTLVKEELGEAEKGEGSAAGTLRLARGTRWESRSGELSWPRMGASRDTLESDVDAWLSEGEEGEETSSPDAWLPSPEEDVSDTGDMGDAEEAGETGDVDPAAAAAAAAAVTAPAACCACTSACTLAHCCNWE